MGMHDQHATPLSGHDDQVMRRGGILTTQTAGSFGYALRTDLSLRRSFKRRGRYAGATGQDE